MTSAKFMPSCDAKKILKNHEYCGTDYCSQGSTKVYGGHQLPYADIPFQDMESLWPVTFVV